MVDEYCPDGIRSLCYGMIDFSISFLESEDIQSIRYESSLRWFTSVDYKHPLSFHNVCEVLGFEPTYILKRVLNKPKVKKRLEKQGILENILSKLKEMD